MNESVSLNAEFTLKTQVATGNFDSICLYPQKCLVPPCSPDGKESTCNVGDLGLIPGLGRSPGEGNGNPLQYSCLENPMNRGAWWSTVHDAELDTTERLTFTYLQKCLGLVR